MSLWHDTHIMSTVTLGDCITRISVFSALDDAGKPTACLSVTPDNPYISTRVSAHLSADQMRALAAHLHQHADRLEQLQAQAATLPQPIAEAA